MTINELIDTAKQEAANLGRADEPAEVEYWIYKQLTRMPLENFVAVLLESGLLPKILEQKFATGSTIRNGLFAPYIHAAVMALVAGEK